MSTILEAPVKEVGDNHEFHSLGPELTRSFAVNGVACVRGLLTQAEVEELREWVEIAINNPAKPVSGKRTYIIETHLSKRFKGFNDFLYQSRIAEAAAAIMGSREVRFYNDTIFVKEPSAPEPSPWHQDQPYCFFGGMDNCATWIPLDPANEASGAMTYALGSHRWGKMFSLPDSTDPSTAFDGPAPDIESNPELYPTVVFDVRPGDVVFHHLMTMHKAGPNTSKGTRRRVLSNRFVGDDAVWMDRPFAHAKIEADLQNGEPMRGSQFPLLWPH